MEVFSKSKYMKKYISFALATLLLTSCSFDWNWKNDKEIANLKTQIQELKAEKDKAFICPENMSDPNAQVDAVSKFIKVYSEKNPDATLADMNTYRFNMLTENKCVKTLANMLQKVSPDDLRIYFNWKVFWPQNFQFTPDTAVGTAYYTIGWQWLDSPDEELMFNFYIKDIWSQKIFSAKSVADNIINSYKGSLNSSVINSFIAPDKITGLGDYFIISKAIYSGYAYVYVMKISTIGDSVFSVTYSRKFTDSNTNLSTNIDNWLIQDSSLSSEWVSNRLADIWVDEVWVNYIKNIGNNRQNNLFNTKSDKTLIIQQDVNLRDSPGNGSVIIPILKWETVSLIAKDVVWNNTWFNIQYNGYTGWISEIGLIRDDTKASGANCDPINGHITKQGYCSCNDSYKWNSLENKCL